MNTNPCLCGNSGAYVPSCPKDDQFYADEAEKWATGQVDGEDIGKDEVQYHNNSKWYSEKSKEYSESAKEYAKKAEESAGDAAEAACESANHAAESATSADASMRSALESATAAGKAKASEESAAASAESASTSAKEAKNAVDKIGDSLERAEAAADSASESAQKAADSAASIGDSVERAEAAATSAEESAAKVEGVIEEAEEAAEASKYYSEIAKRAIDHKTIKVTIPASAWVNGEATVTAEGVSPGNDVAVFADIETYDEVAQAGIRAKSVAIDKITLTCKNTPESDVIIDVIIASDGEGGEVPNDYNALSNKPTINGVELKGELTSADLSLPKILFDTEANWNAHSTLVSENEVIYVYTDHKEDSLGKAVPGFKVGDGSAYLIDIPFADAVEAEHIANTVIHVTAQDKTNWNEQISARADGETLVLY